MMLRYVIVSLILLTAYAEVKATNAVVISNVKVETSSAQRVASDETEEVDTEVPITCRNPAVKRAFDKMMGYPRGRKGYVVDHVCPLAVGGLDSVLNMQYQTIVEGKKKDKIELLPIWRDTFCNKMNSLPYRTVWNCK